VERSSCEGEGAQIGGRGRRREFRDLGLSTLLCEESESDGGFSLDLRSDEWRVQVGGVKLLLELCVEEVPTEMPSEEMVNVTTTTLTCHQNQGRGRGAGRVYTWL
jgi:hypothetical protein